MSPKSRTTVGVGCRFAAVLFAISIAGCGEGGVTGVEDEFQRAILQLNNMKASLDHAVTRFDIASASWQETVKKLEADFSENNQALLGRTLKNTLEDVVSHTSSEVRADIDYVEAKVKGLLSTLATAVADAKKDLQEKQKTVKRTEIDKARSIIAEVLQKVATTPVYLPPFISSVTPAEVGLLHTDHTAKAVVFPVSPVVKAHGWGFHQPASAKWKLSAVIRKGDGSGETPLVQESGEITYSLTTDYLLQLTFAKPSVFLGHHGNKLVLISDTDPKREYEIPIVITTPKKRDDDKKAIEITSGKVVLFVTDDDKDREDEIVVQLLADNVVVYEGVKGKGEVWKDWSGPYPYGGALKRPVARGTRGKVNIIKRPTDNGVSLRVEVSGKDKDGVEYVYSRDWGFHLEDEVLATSLDFTW
jgi:hypothetical protein